MDCVIAAGGRPVRQDPLFPYTNGQPKALLDIGGRAMIEWVVEAVQASISVEDVLVVGLDENALAGLSFPRPVYSLPDQGGLAQNAIAGMQWVNRRRPGSPAVMLSSADVPLVNGKLLDALVDACRPFDCALYYVVVDEATMEARFPGSRRTFVPLKEGPVAGGDIVIAQPQLADMHPELWHALANARKHAWKLARLIGPGTLIKYLLRRLSTADIEAIGQRIIGRPVKVLLLPFAELAMDADKPQQVELLRRELNRQPN